MFKVVENNNKYTFIEDNNKVYGVSYLEVVGIYDIVKKYFEIGNVASATSKKHLEKFVDFIANNYEDVNRENIIKEIDSRFKDGFKNYNERMV